MSYQVGVARGAPTWYTGVVHGGKGTPIMENRYWLLTVGPYDDEETLGLVTTGPKDALAIANRIMIERVQDPDISRDMVEVRMTQVVELS